MGYLGWISSGYDRRSWDISKDFFFGYVLGYCQTDILNLQKMSIDILGYHFTSQHIPRSPKISNGATSQMSGQHDHATLSGAGRRVSLMHGTRSQTTCYVRRGTGRVVYCPIIAFSFLGQGHRIVDWDQSYSKETSQRHPHKLALF